MSPLCIRQEISAVLISLMETTEREFTRSEFREGRKVEGSILQSRNYLETQTSASRGKRFSMPKRINDLKWSNFEVFVDADAAEI